VTAQPPDKAAVNKIFGTDFESESSDDRDPETPADAGERDRWMRDNVPPHHI